MKQNKVVPFQLEIQKEKRIENIEVTDSDTL